MWPDIVSEGTAVLCNGTLQHPSRISGAAMLAHCVRVTLRGGHSFDAPAHATVRASTTSRTRLAVNNITIGTMLPAPTASPAPSKPLTAYYHKTTVPTKAGGARIRAGMVNMTPNVCELLGWLCGAGQAMTTADQSIRFSSSNAAILQRMQLLCAKAFPTMAVKWYAKNVGYDLTMTGHGSQALKSLMRTVLDVPGTTFPIGINRLPADRLRDFLRGLWGAAGWVSVRKGGNDVDCGLARTSDDDEYTTSAYRLLHALIGMHGQSRAMGKNAHRLVFSGYQNYAVLFREIGQVGSQKLGPPPVRRPRGAPKTVAIDGIQWYEAPVVKVIALPGSRTCYHLGTHV